MIVLSGWASFYFEFSSESDIPSNTINIFDILLIFVATIGKNLQNIRQEPLSKFHVKCVNDVVRSYQI